MIFRRPFRWLVQVWLAGFFSKIANEARHLRDVERLEHQIRLANEDTRTMAMKVKYYQEVWAAETAIQSRRIVEAKGERR